ncbi:MAG: SpaA isopeptide-forming pilin-related protein [Erysipelotrichaceae bacterium]
MKKIRKILITLTAVLITFTSLGLGSLVNVKALASISGDSILAQAKTYDSWSYNAVGTCTGLVTRTLDDLGIADSIVGSMVGNTARYSPDQMLANARSFSEAQLIYEGTASGAYAAGVKNGDLVIASAADMGGSFGHVAFIEWKGDRVGWYGANNPINNVSWQLFGKSSRGIPSEDVFVKNVHIFRLAEDIQPTYATLNATKSSNENVLVSLTKTDVDNNKVLSNVTFDFYRDNVKFETSTTNGNGIATANFAKSYTATSGTKTYCTNYDQLDANGKQKVANSGAFAYQSQAQSSADTEAQNSANAMANQNHSYMAIETVTKTKYWLNADNDRVTNGITGSGNVSMSLTNKRVLATANITKTDTDTGKTEGQGDATLEGAVYGLYARENILDPSDDSVIYRANTLIKSVTITNSKASVSDLYLGKYFWKEISSSNGYKLDTREYNFELSYAGQTVSVVSNSSTVKEDVITGDFDLEKVITDAQESEIVEKEQGAEFIVVLKKYVDKYGSIEEAYAHRGEFTNKEFDKLVTNEDGYDKTNPLAFGTYVVKQTKGQIDTDKVKAEWEFKVEKENQKTIRYIVNNRPFNSYLKLVKKDGDSGKTVVLDSATFKIFDVDNNKYITQKVGDEKTSEFTTNKKGYVVLPLKLRAGNYRLEEIKAPYNYLLNTQKVDFKITSKLVSETDKDGDPIQIVEFTNKAVKGQVSLKKNGQVFVGTEVKEDGTLKLLYEDKGLAGMEGNLYAEENVIDPADGSILFSKDELVTSLVTDGEGEWSSNEIYLGKYRFEETKAPIGFVKLKKPIILTFEYKDDNTPLISEELNVRNSRPTYELDFTKHLEVNDIENPEAYKDVVFGVYTRDDTYNYKGDVAITPNTLVYTSGIDEKGKLTTDFELPVGNYFIKELATNEAYVLETKEYDFLISQSNEAKVKVSINEGKPLTNDLKDFKVLVNKVDSQTKKNVISKDFEFTRYANKECTKEIDKAVANTKDGNAMFDDIHYGITYIKETKAPTGYLLSDEVVKIEVNNEGVFVNDRKYAVDDKDVYSIIYQNSLMPAVKKVVTGDFNNNQIFGLFIILSLLGICGIKFKQLREEV